MEEMRVLQLDGKKKQIKIFQDNLNILFKLWNFISILFTFLKFRLAIKEALYPRLTLPIYRLHLSLGGYWSASVKGNLRRRRLGSENGAKRPGRFGWRC